CSVWPTAVFLILALASSAIAQQLSPRAQQQIQELMMEKANRTAAQRKMDSHLVFASKMARGQSITPSVPALPTAAAHVNADAGNQVTVEVHGPVTPDLLAFIASLGGAIVASNPQSGVATTKLPLLAVEQIAQRPEVRFVTVPGPRHSNGATAKRDMAQWF